MATEVLGLDRLNGAVSLFITELGVDARDILQQTARQLANDFMTETAPFITDLNTGKTAAGSNKKVAKDTGIDAIRHDLLNAITPASQLFDESFKNKYVEKLVKNKNVMGLQKFLDNTPKLKGWKVVPFDEHLHTDQRNRNKRYRIPHSLKKLTFDEREHKRYQQSLEKRVGYSKSGWGFAVAAFGGKVAAWISRHFGYCKGQVKINIDNPNPSIEFSNSTPDIDRYLSRYERTMEVRADLMAKDLHKKMNLRIKAAGLN